jgi:hypothetical protein
MITEKKTHNFIKQFCIYEAYAEFILNESKRLKEAWTDAANNRITCNLTVEKQEILTNRMNTAKEVYRNFMEEHHPNYGRHCLLVPSLDVAINQKMLKKTIKASRKKMKELRASSLYSSKWFAW